MTAQKYELIMHWHGGTKSVAGTYCNELHARIHGADLVRALPEVYESFEVRPEAQQEPQK